MYRLVPVFFALIQSRKDNRDECNSILTDQVDNPVIIPEVQSPLSNLMHQHSNTHYTTTGWKIWLVQIVTNITDYNFYQILVSVNLCTLIIYLARYTVN